jgi:methyl-accepting chemotaxis protein
VTSLQFHDITRQQVEHAAAAFERAGEISPGEAALLVKICDLEGAQLEHAREAFLAAVTQVKESLARIASSVRQMSEQASAVMAGGGDGTFLGEMEQGFAGIRTALAECAESRHSLGMVANAVADEVREMSGFLAAIEEIGIRMQRIALNANVKAILMGEQGCALGAVADAIQRLAAESSSQTEAVWQGIRAVAESSERMRAELLESGADLAAELERVIQAFHRADRDNVGRLAEIGETRRSFSADLDALRAGIHADRVLDEVIGGTCERLREVVEKAGPLALEEKGAEVHEMIHDLESQYTMHAERAVHQQAAGEAAVVAQAREPGDLGENVELF